MRVVFGTICLLIAATPAMASAVVRSCAAFGGWTPGCGSRRRRVARRPPIQKKVITADQGTRSRVGRRQSRN